MIRYLFIFLLLTSTSFANEFKLLELDEVRIDYMNFFRGGRDPLITNNGIGNRELGKLLDLNINSTIAKYGYWRSLIHSYTDAYVDSHKDAQFRSVGLNMEVGIRISPYLDIYAWHYSQHLLDTTTDNIGGYPLQNGVGIHLYLFSNERKDSIIK